MSIYCEPLCNSAGVTAGILLLLLLFALLLGSLQDTVSLNVGHLEHYLFTANAVTKLCQMFNMSFLTQFKHVKYIHDFAIKWHVKSYIGTFCSALLQ
jgi:hypothetical protein